MSKDHLVEAIARAILAEEYPLTKWEGTSDAFKLLYERKAQAAISAIEREGWTLTPPRKIEGATFVCELPRELGEITGMRVEGDRLVCDTKSGIPFVVSASPKQG